MSISEEIEDTLRTPGDPHEQLDTTLAGEKMAGYLAKLRPETRDLLVMRYIDDLPEMRGTLHAAPILSPVAHGQLSGVDVSAALAAPGVRGVVLAAHVYTEREAELARLMPEKVAADTSK